MQRFFDICGQLFSTLVVSPRPIFLEYIVILLIHLVTLFKCSGYSNHGTFLSSWSFKKGQHYALNVRSRGKQLVLFSRESWCFRRRSRGKQFRTRKRRLTVFFPPAITPPLYSYHSYNHQYEYYKNKNKNNNGTKLPSVWILHVMFYRSNSINMGIFFIYLFL